VSTSESGDPTEHSYVPGPCDYPSCGRSLAEHKRIVLETASAALAAAPHEAEDHVLHHALRMATALHHAGNRLQRAILQARASGQLVELAGLVQDNVLPSLAPDLHVDVRRLAALAGSSPAAAAEPPPAAAPPLLDSERDPIAELERLAAEDQAQS
jgi:hypothetical protein